MRTCTYPGCGLKHYAKDYCAKHYHRYRRHGDPGIVLQIKCPKRVKNTLQCSRDSYKFWMEIRYKPQ